LFCTEFLFIQYHQILSPVVVAKWLLSRWLYFFCLDSFIFVILFQEMVLDLGTYSAQLLNFVAQQVIQPRLMAPVSNVAVAAFMAFCSFSKWLSVELLLQPEHEAVIVAGLNMQNMQIKVACLDWCHCVVKHTARPGDEPLLVRLLGTIIAYTNRLCLSRTLLEGPRVLFSLVCSVSAAGVGSSDQYQLLKACCSIVSDAVIKQQSLLARNPQIASAFSSCMLFFSQAPGIELATNAMSSWKVLDAPSRFTTTTL
jgi:hypothetical protein